ncbi:MAG: hypothetical protein ACRDRK_00815 [Pseudonocardia sp.]
MRRTTRLALLATVLATVLVSTGCTTAVPGIPAVDPAPVPTEGPGSDPVAWTDRLCASLLTVKAPLLVKPDYGATPNLRSIQREFSSYLGDVITGTQQSRTELAAIGRSPVAGGDEAVTRLDGVLNRLDLDFTEVKAKVDVADTKNIDAFLAALGEVEDLISNINAPNALAELADIPQLDRAAERAPACEELDSVSVLPPG